MSTTTPAPAPSPRRQFLGFAFKLALVGGLLFLLARKGLFSISIEETRRALTQWDFIIPAVLCFLTASALGVVRWQVLLRAQGIRLPWGRTFQLTYIGNFFNIALPGAVSGDLIKAIYIGKEVEGKRARAFGSILFDRITGLSALVIVCAAALAIGFEHFWGTPMFRAVQVFVSIAAAGFFGFYAYLLLIRDGHDPLLRLLERWSQRQARIGSILRVYEGLRQYHRNRGAVLQALLISIVVQVLIAFMCSRLALALNESQIHLLPILVVVPLGLLATAIPLLPGGVGTGHVAFFTLFALIGSQRGGDIFTLFLVMNLALGAVGGLIYLRFKSHVHLPPVNSA